MAKLSKRMRAIRELIDSSKSYSITDAVAILQKQPAIKFVQSIDVSVNLGVDVKKNQVVRGACVLPNGTGKQVRVAVFAQGDNAEAAKAAGADIVGFEDLAESIKKGQLNFDVCIATPDAMRVVGPLGTILGPRGLMPNPKVGTVTTDVTTAVSNAKSGQALYRTDKNGVIHCRIGSLEFTAAQIEENIRVLLSELKKAKPAEAKGIYLRKVSLSSTMGPGIAIDLNTIGT